jgi:hypothetical protein
MASGKQVSESRHFSRHSESRKEADIERAFRESFTSIRIAAWPADLRLHVQAEVANRRKLRTFATSEVREQVIDRLVNKADGM